MSHAKSQIFEPLPTTIFTVMSALGQPAKDGERAPEREPDGCDRRQREKRV